VGCCQSWQRVRSIECCWANTNAHGCVVALSLREPHTQWQHAALRSQRLRAQCSHVRTQCACSHSARSLRLAASVRCGCAVVLRACMRVVSLRRVGWRGAARLWTRRAHRRRGQLRRPRSQRSRRRLGAMKRIGGLGPLLLECAARCGGAAERRRLQQLQRRLRAGRARTGTARRRSRAASARQAQRVRRGVLIRHGARGGAMRAARAIRQEHGGAAARRRTPSAAARSIHSATAPATRSCQHQVRSTQRSTQRARTRTQHCTRQRCSIRATQPREFPPK